MGIFRALGLGLTIIILKFLVPEVFSGLENTLVVFFDTAQNGLELTNSNLDLIASPTSLNPE